ncbi:hypothetical protein [Desulfotomaculum sp. 1211_IL3151]
MYDMDDSRPDMLETGIRGWVSPDESEEEIGLDFYQNWSAHW